MQTLTIHLSNEGVVDSLNVIGGFVNALDTPKAFYITTYTREFSNFDDQPALEDKLKELIISQLQWYTEGSRRQKELKLV
jgi:hypothetical protein